MGSNNNKGVCPDCGEQHAKPKGELNGKPFEGDLVIVIAITDAGEIGFRADHHMYGHRFTPGHIVAMMEALQNAAEKCVEKLLTFNTVEPSDEAAPAEDASEGLTH